MHLTVAQETLLYIGRPGLPGICFKGRRSGGMQGEGIGGEGARN